MCGLRASTYDAMLVIYQHAHKMSSISVILEPFTSHRVEPW